MRVGEFARAAPATAAVMAVCIGLFIAVFVSALVKETAYEEQLSPWGAVTNFVWHAVDGDPEPEEPQGPFRVWDGQYWRIFVTGLHHAGPVHLFLNMSSLFVFGLMLERRFGWFSYLVVLLGGMVISLEVPLLFGVACVGISGGLCSLLGALITRRLVDPDLRRDVPADYVHRAVLTLLVFSITVEMAGIPIGHFAHLVGFLYGLLMGLIPAHSYSLQGSATIGTLAAVLTLGWYDAHPAWSGDWYYHLSRKTDDPELRIKDLAKATELNPRLAMAWAELVNAQWSALQQGTPWKTALKGLAANPTNPVLAQQAAELRRYYLQEEPEQDVDEDLRQAFGDGAPHWLSMFEHLAPFEEAPWRSPLIPSVPRHLPKVRPPDHAEEGSST